MFASLLISQALLLAITLHAALIGAAAGTPFFRALRETAANPALEAFFALALGLALQIALLFVVGAAGALAAPVLIALGAATSGLALVWLARSGAGKAHRRLEPADIAIALALYLLVASTALRVPGYFDDTLYHLPLARFYAQTHGIGLDRWLRFPLFPQNMELLFALAFALRPGDFVLAQGLASLPAFVVALGLVGAARWLRGSTALGVGASVAFLALHVVDKTLGYAYIDLGLALFCFATLLGALAIRARTPLGVYIVLGILGGTAAGCKIHGLVAAALAFALLPAFGARPRALLAFAGATALFGCGWYLRSYAISGDPVSPAGGPWFGYFLWDAQDLASQRAEQQSFLRGSELYRLPHALVKGGANLIIPALLAPLAARRERLVILALWAVLFAYVLIWFYFSQIDRYLAPVLAIGVLLSVTFFFDLCAFVGERHAPRVVEFAARPATSAVLIVALLIGYGVHAFDRASHDLRKWDQILASRPGYVAFQRAHALAPRYGSRLLQIGFEGSIYFYEGTAIGDWFGPGRYSQTVAFAEVNTLVPAAEMRKALASFDARLLALNLQFVRFDEADYRTQFDVILDDGKQALLAVKPAS